MLSKAILTSWSGMLNGQRIVAKKVDKLLVVICYIIMHNRLCCVAIERVGSGIR